MNLFLVVAALCLGTWSAGQNPPSMTPVHAEGDVVIPFVYDPPALPFIVVEGRINDSGALKFIVDTGASPPLLIDRWAAEMLGLKPGRRATVMPGAVRVAETNLSGFALKLAGSNNYIGPPFRSAFIADLGYMRRSFGGYKIAGVIGAPLFTMSAVRLDFGAKTLTLEGKPLPLSKIPGASVMPLTKRKGGFITQIAIPGGKPFDVMIDTGSDHTSLMPAQAARLHPRASSLMMSGTFDGAIHLGILSRLDGLRLGDYVEREVEVDDQPPTGTPILGLDLLSRFLATFDLRNRRLILERPADYAARVRLAGWSGVEVGGANGRYFVRRVQPSSPAAGSDTRPGDRLVEIDGRPIGAVDPQGVQKLLDGFAGRPAQIALLRGGTQITVGFTRAEVFADPIRKSLGFALSKPPFKPFVVDAVARDSGAAKAGLRPGDEVIELNGVLTANLTWDRMGDVIGRPNRSVTVRSRSGVTRTIRLDKG